jgi:hypothetical protein
MIAYVLWSTGDSSKFDDLLDAHNFIEDEVIKFDSRNGDTLFLSFHNIRFIKLVRKEAEV